MLKELPGYDPDAQKNRAEARQIMEELGYGPAHRLSIKVTSQEWSIYRDPAVLLTDQLKQVHIDARARAGRDRSVLPENSAQGL